MYETIEATEVTIKDKVVIYTVNIIERSSYISRERQMELDPQTLEVKYDLNNRYQASEYKEFIHKLAKKHGFEIDTWVQAMNVPIGLVLSLNKYRQFA